jgi:hypothetical protein
MRRVMHAAAVAGVPATSLAASPGVGVETAAGGDSVTGAAVPAAAARALAGDRVTPGLGASHGPAAAAMAGSKMAHARLCTQQLREELASLAKGKSIAQH